jgi:hypothetical protein
MGAKQKTKVYLLIASLQSVMVAFLLFFAGSSSTVSAAAGINSQLSFEGKIVKSDGTNITNGTYNMEFKIYQDGTNTGSGSTLKWTEDRLVGGSGGVTLTDGTFQVNLGSVNPFGSQVDWNQDTLWLSMQIGNSASCTISTTFQTNCGGDGEMTPYIRLTAVPYAQNAATLNGIAASGFIQNSTNPQTANFNVVSASSGSVAATIQGASGQSVDIAEIKVNGVANPVFKVASNGSTTLQSPTSQGSLTALQVQNSTGASLLTADTTNMRVGVGVTYAAMSTSFGTPSVTDAGSGSLNSGLVYYYKVTAIDSAGGETTPSSEGTMGVVGHTAFNVSWTAIPRASGYRIYRSSASGAEKYYTTVLTNSFTDTGQFATSTTNAPSSNGAYTNTNNSNSSLQLSVGGLGSPTGQVYISGIQPIFIGKNSDSKLSLPQSVYISGRYAYIASHGTNKLAVYDISNPASPTFVGQNSDSNLNGPLSVSVQGRYAYVANDGSNKLAVYDISNPASPTFVGQNSDSNLIAPQSVYVSGRYAYLANWGNNKLAVYDISNPASPTFVAQNSDSNLNEPINIYVQGRYAYVASYGNNKLAVCDISNPASFSCVTNSDSNLFSPASVYVQGRYAYIASQASNTLVIYDISNPASPTFVGQNSDSNLSSPLSVYVQGRYAYVASTNSNKLVIYDISNPASPTFVGQNSDSNLNSPQTESLFVQGRYAYMINHGDSKLLTYDLGGAYTQQLEAGSAELGTLNVNSNSAFAGDISIQGALGVGQSLQVNGNIGSSGSALFQSLAGSAAAFQIQDNSGSNLLTVNSLTRTAGIAGNAIKIGNSTGTDADTTILVLDSTASTPTINLASLNGGLFYNSNTGHINAIENGAVKEICNKTDLGCGTGSLQQAYDASAGGTTPEIVIGLNANTGGVDIQNLSTASISGASLLAVRDKAANNTTLGTALFSVSDRGETTVRGNASGSTSLFQVQGNGSIFNVDSTMNHVSIDSMLATLSSTFFLTSSACSSSCPAGTLTNGAVYR